MTRTWPRHITLILWKVLIHHSFGNEHLVNKLVWKNQYGSLFFHQFWFQQLEGSSPNKLFFSAYTFPFESPNVLQNPFAWAAVMTTRGNWRPVVVSKILYFKLEAFIWRQCPLSMKIETDWNNTVPYYCIF